MVRLGRIFKYFYVILLLPALAACSSDRMLLQTIDDLSGAHIAILGDSVSEDDFEQILPDSKIVHFKSASEFLLSLAIGKCDAGIAEKEVAQILLDRNYDYLSLDFSELQNDSTLVIAHKSILPGRNVSAGANGVIDESIERINDTIISNQYWKLILRGFGATVSMFLLGIVIAFVLAVLMLGMNTSKSLRFISEPISYFIRKIHDVPSVVLIFFFYYVVFATVHVSGIIICSLALGVYTSGSLMNVFSVHLNQIDKNQHAAAEMLGLKGWNKYKYVILPQAVKPMLPFIASESKVLLRATTYAGYISGLDLVKVTEIIRNETYDVLVPLLLVSVVFLILSEIIVGSLSAIYNKVFKYD